MKQGDDWTQLERVKAQYEDTISIAYKGERQKLQHAYQDGLSLQILADRQKKAFYKSTEKAQSHANLVDQMPATSGNKMS